MAGSRSIAAVLGLLVAACPGGPEDAFESEALPVLEQRCFTTACHGVGPGQTTPEAGLFVSVDAAGRVRDIGAARAAALARVATREPVLASTLLREPMPAAWAGGPHAGGVLFTGPDDPALRALRRWIAAEPEGSGGEDLDLDPLEVRFGDEVLPVLVARCGRDGCHGPRNVAFTSFPARPDPLTGLFAPREIRAAREAVRKHLDLWSDDPTRARLIRKALGPAAGGLVHRGGDGTFFPEAPVDRPLEAPGIAAILGWARAEREALGVGEGLAPGALVFARGPIAPRAPFRIVPEREGSDLWITAWPVRPGAEENLTASLHPDGPAEVRDPAVAHDGRRIAFAMRRGTEDRFALWEMDLETRDARRLTAADAPGSFVSPVYAPGGGIVAAWDGHGEVGADADGAAPDLVVVDEQSGDWTRLTFTPHPEVRPAFLAAGKTRGELVFAIRRGGSTPQGVLFRFPLDHDPAHHGEPEYHVQFGATIAPRAPYAARDLPDGRQVLVVLDTVGEVDDRGALAVLDRSLGPVLAPGTETDASVGGYRPALAVVDPELRWRDPAPLPDGRIVAARDGALVVTHLDAGTSEVLLDVPGVDHRSPAPVFARPPEDDPHAPAIDPTLAGGFFVLRDVAILEALYGRAEPRGARELREDLAAVRLVAWAGAREGDFRRFADGSSTLGLGSAAPARVLAEVPLAEDRSALIRVPARTPILLQWLDARGMIAGRQLDRWFYAEGAERVPGGTNAATYAHDCAGCHGALSGRPEDAAGPAPDAISAASVTRAAYVDRDRRRPRDPFDAVAEGRVVDFRSVVGPALRETCAGAGCHGGVTPAADLPLDDRDGARFPAAYEALVGRFVDLAGRRARASAISEQLLGEELDAPGPAGPLCPRRGDGADLVRDVARWIETGALYDAETGDAS